MKWLVTGGCGFIGTALIGRLRREGGHLIRVVDDLSVGTRESLEATGPVTGWDGASGWGDRGEVELAVGDVRDERLALRVAEGADVIVHLAANTGVELSVRNPRDDCTINVLGTLNYLEAARHCGVRRFVFASSGAPVGEVEPPIHEELAPHPVSPYGASKLAGEGYCSAYHGAFGLETVALRFSNVYGPGSSHKGSVVAKFIRLALQGLTWELYGGGQQTRDFLYIDDLVDAVVRSAVTPGLGGELFQIASGRETRVVEMAQLLAAALRRQGVEPPPMKEEAPRVGDVRRNYSDVTKAKRILGWRPETKLENGLEQTVEYFLLMLA